jgi:GNAT superfamily N-acetyltransferase
MRAKEYSKESDNRAFVQKYIPWIAEQLGIKELPEITLLDAPVDTTFGQYNPETKTLNVVIANRNPIDVLRTLAHELTHHKQNLAGELTAGAGETGTPQENEANANAGVVMRDFAEANPEYFGLEKSSITEEAFNGIDINIEIQKDDEYVDDDDYDNQVMYVTASSNGRELGHVLFAFDGDELLPQDLEVEERYRGQGIAQTMYDYVTSKGYKIRRSGQQTDAGAGFWAKHRPEQNVWEETTKNPAQDPAVVALLNKMNYRMWDKGAGEYMMTFNNTQLEFNSAGVFYNGPPVKGPNGVKPNFGIKWRHDPDWASPRGEISFELAWQMGLFPKIQGIYPYLQAMDKQGYSDRKNCLEIDRAIVQSAIDYVRSQNKVNENMDHGKDKDAVEELRAALEAHKKQIQAVDDNEDKVYNIIDKIMTRVAKSHGISGQKMHDLWVEKYKQIPDTWIMNENFADGKHPGRKGLSKRMGVNTKASVSSLRRTAKHSTGEKASMAHWLANMKAGKARAKKK